MKFGLPDRTLRTLDLFFRVFPGIKSVTIYGSRAKGNYRPGSDIDITLHTDDTFTDDDFSCLRNLLEWSDLPYFVDVSIYDKLKNEDLKAHIQRVGKPFYRDGKIAPDEPSGGESPVAGVEGGFGGIFQGVVQGGEKVDAGA
jgi:type I restriction enzyme R subunit